MLEKQIAADHDGGMDNADVDVIGCMDVEENSSENPDYVLSAQIIFHLTVMGVMEFFETKFPFLEEYLYWSEDDSYDSYVIHVDDTSAVVDEVIQVETRSSNVEGYKGVEQ